jgi:ribose 5-phosphate isomerase B
MKIAIGSDHAGFDRKSLIVSWLESKGYEVKDLGTHSADSVDYPDYAHAVADSVASSNADLGILICGSANGVAITANKHQKIRAAICWNAEIASLAVQHNDANICCIPARFTSEAETNDILEAFFSAEFEGGRHANRVNKIACS